MVKPIKAEESNFVFHGSAVYLKIPKKMFYDSAFPFRKFGKEFPLIKMFKDRLVVEAVK